MRRDIISAIHADIRAARQTIRGSTMRKPLVPQGKFKEYPRMRGILLPQISETEKPHVSLLEAQRKRRSFNESDRAYAQKQYALKEISILFESLRVQDGTKRSYPSGGGFYPIETYFIGSLKGAASGVFHYHPGIHALEHLWGMPETFVFADLFSDADRFLKRARGAIILTSVWERAAAAYGDFAYNLALLEAGHIGQNLLLTSTTLTMPARPIGGFVDEVIYELLDIDGNEEQVVYVIALF